MIEVIDVRRAGDLGDEPGGAVGPTDKTVPVRRTHFIYSQKRKEEVNVQNMYRTWNHWNHLIRGLFKLFWGATDRSLPAERKDASVGVMYDFAVCLTEMTLVVGL